MAAALKQDTGIDVALIDGKTGELTVLVDDRVVAKKRWFSKLSIEKVLAAVRAANSATTETKV